MQTKQRARQRATSAWSFWAIRCSGLWLRIICLKITRNFPEGDLTKNRAALVCEKACCGFAKQIGLGNYLRLSHGEQNSGGRTRSSILADAFEAVIAAIYLDGGMEEARKFILRFVLPHAEGTQAEGV